MTTPDLAALERKIGQRMSVLDSVVEIGPFKKPRKVRQKWERVDNEEQL